MCKKYVSTEEEKEEKTRTKNQIGPNVLLTWCQIFRCLRPRLGESDLNELTATGIDDASFIENEGNIVMWQEDVGLTN